MFSLEKLNPRHFKILDLCVLGWTISDIAKHLGMANSTISTITNSPSFQHEFAIRREKYEEQFDSKSVDNINDVTDALKAGALSAANKLVSSLNSSDAALGLRSATEILDRTGHPKTQRTEGTGPAVVVINSLDASRLSETLNMDK